MNEQAGDRVGAQVSGCVKEEELVSEWMAGGLERMRGCWGCYPSFRYCTLI